VELVSFAGLPNCYRLSNQTVEVTVATDFGPRILGYNFVGGQNILGTCPESSRTTPWGEWKPWGGHRLWLAPEAMPRSYVPDNSPIEIINDGPASLRLIGNTEEPTGVQKEMHISLASVGSAIQITHRITNRGLWPIEASLWALTIMRVGGIAIVPQEPFRPFPEVLQPVRPLSLWSYTDLSDRRFEITSKEIRLRSEESLSDSQKFGVGNTLGWCAYLNGEDLFVKRFPFEPTATYPDFGCNNEIYTAGSFIEVESLSPLHQVQPGESAEHIEKWELFVVKKGESTDQFLWPTAPLINQ
jgi:hypothetical protein